MKKRIYTICFLLVSYCCQAQTAIQTAHLAKLAQVWGFLKHYHPSAALGQPDWDKELLRMIPLAEQVKTGKQLDSLLHTWYRSLPAVKLSATPVHYKADTLVQFFSERNIKKIGVARPLREELVRLYQYRLPGISRYATRYYKKYYLDYVYHTEDAHDEKAYPDRAMRLLALFRYWNIIEYFYPHRLQLAPHWDRVLTDYIPRFCAASDSLEYRQVIKELIHELQDSHSFIQEPGDVFRVSPFRLISLDGKKFFIAQCDDSIANKFDYRAGDEVIAVNGISMATRREQLLRKTTGTNQLSLYRNLANDLLKTGDSVVDVSFIRNGKTFTKTVTLHSWPVYSAMPGAPFKLWEEKEKGIWYVRFCRITQPDTLQRLFADIRDAKAVIWDMRDYPNYNVTLALRKYVFGAKIKLSEELNASDSFPGVFIRSSTYYQPDTAIDLIYKGRMIVLVDEQTQSLSESVAAMLRLRSNTITMGRQTAGTTGNISWFSLPGDIAVSYTAVSVTGVNDSFRQGIGVKLDVPLKLTEEKIRSGKDVMLDEAIRYAQQ